MLVASHLVHHPELNDLLKIIESECQYWRDLIATLFQHSGIQSIWARCYMYISQGTFNLYNSSVTYFGSTVKSVMTSMEENGLAPFEGRSESMFEG